MNLVHIDTDICKGCNLCIHFCPCDVLILSEQHNERGFTVAEVSDPDSCTGCRLCQIVCPDLAIYVEKD